MTWLGVSLVDMIWSVDIGLDELVVESKSSESTSENERQKNGERDKQTVADLVKKLLVSGKRLSTVVRGAERVSYRLPESFNQVLAGKDLIVA